MIITKNAAILFVGTTLMVGPCASAHAQTKTPPARSASKPDSAQQNEQTYRNSTYAFRFQIPYGWVDRTRQMGEGAEPGKSEVLLAIFTRPPEATGDTINSAVIIASEAAASYPGVKRAEDYSGPLTELTVAQGFKPDGDPYAVDVEGHHLLRADFIKPITDKLAMQQCTLVWLTKGQIITFTFIAGSDEELDDLMDNLHFAAK